ncbi:hypothetical protein GZH46_01122 [Fragariocoptes setiger]|uniref:Guanine nucleotide-binding protein G(s) subunit alpha n=1 Tax=Fragariocoptes setiger TaxID=1670756 RepID=A0ABQ7SA98_9ACAR|nr:hypothetical protein GZH46_01122 [Fragariocoptes setiger]
MKSLVCFRPCDPFKRKSKELDQRIASWSNNFNSSYKLLLLGPAGAGKTTILKQMKIIHFEGFSHEERLQKAKEIRTNLLESVRELTSSIKASGNEINWADPENQRRLDFINNINLDDSTYELYAAKIYDYAKRILTDKGVEEHFAKVNQISITCRSKYLLTRVNEIRNSKYVPNDDDILRSRRKTDDIQKIEFQVKPPRKYGTVPQTFWMFDVGGQRGERRKWIQVFDGVTAVMFLVDCSSFDAVDDEMNGRNRLRETMSLFYDVWTTRFLRNSNFVLLFNKQDILRSKIERGHRVEAHFPEYAHYRPSAEDVSDPDCPDYEYIRARSFIRDKFLNITRRTEYGATAPINKLSMPNTLNSMYMGGGRQHKSHSVCHTPTPTHSHRTLTHSGTHALNGCNDSNGYNGRTNTHLMLTNAHRLNHTNCHIAAPSVLNLKFPAQKQQQQQQQSGQVLSQRQSQSQSQLQYKRANSSSHSSIKENIGQLRTHTPIASNGRYGKAKATLVPAAPNNLPMSSGDHDQPRRTVCYHYTTATDTDNIRCLFEELQIMVIKASMKSTVR